MTKQRPSSWICYDGDGNVNKNCPHENAKKFNLWVRDKLPDSSTGFLASDLDLILWNHNTRKLMLLEVKSHKAKMKFWQESLFGILDSLIKFGVNKLTPPIEYKGFHCIRFENTDFSDGRCLFDKKSVNENELIEILSMEGHEELF